MPFKSKAQRRKFAELLVKGKISDEVYEEWNRSTGRKELPERLHPKPGAKQPASREAPRPTVKKSGKRKVKSPVAKQAVNRKVVRSATTKKRARPRSRRS